MNRQLRIHTVRQLGREIDKQIDKKTQFKDIQVCSKDWIVQQTDD